MEAMTTQDATFLFAENEDNHLHIALVAIFEGPVPPGGEITEMVASKLDQIPRYRQIIRFVPFQLGPPFWVDDPHFDIHYHVRRTALPSPGSQERLEMLVGRLTSQRLDPARPLWELWVVEGLAEGRWALISKVHHCMVDGIAGTDLMSTLLDTSPDERHAPGATWEPEPAPSPLGLIAGAVWENTKRPIEGLRALQRVALTPRRALRSLADFTEGLANFRAFSDDEVEDSLNGPIGPHRRWCYVQFPKEHFDRVGATHGGTLNDVALAAITLGLRALLEARGAKPGERSVRTFVPVSVRQEDERGKVGNRVVAVLAELPVDRSDPVACLEAVHEEMERIKGHHQIGAVEALAVLLGFSPTVVFALAARFYAQHEQHTVQLITTNVPGPTTPLYAAGRRLLEAHPFVPLASGVRIGVAIFTYAGTLSIGITGDYESAPDIDVLARGIEDGVAALLEAS
jgi:WS/DGAT/MGAT family acyltransferase